VRVLVGDGDNVNARVGVDVCEAVGVIVDVAEAVAVIVSI
jgi:hypothetical protein